MYNPFSSRKCQRLSRSPSRATGSAYVEAEILDVRLV